MSAETNMHQFFEKHSFSISNRIRRCEIADPDRTVFGLVVDGKDLRFELSVSMHDSKVRPGDVTSFCRHHLGITANTRTGDDGWLTRDNDFAVCIVDGHATFVLSSDAIRCHRTEKDALRKPITQFAEIVSGEVRWSA